MQPLAPNQRDVFLDAVRGLALLGILAVNLEHFAGVGLYAARQGASESYTLGRELLAFFFSGKFYTIFAILFGLGLALQYRRLVSAGLDAHALLRRRLGWLLGVGVVHGIFLFEGDILGIYAILGFFALRYLGKEHQPLNIAKFLLAGYGLYGLFVFFLRDMAPIPGNAEVFVNGNFWAVSAARLEVWLSSTLLGSLLFGAELVGLFLLGSYLAPRWQTMGPATLWRVVSLGLLVGIPVNWYNAQHPDLQPLRGLGGLAFALVYMALFRLFWPRLSLLHPLRYAGRIPLSNYLLQSLAMSLLFYGYGLGLYGQVNPIWFPLIAVGFVVLQVVLSRWWLERFEQGPLEGWWRRFTYGTPTSPPA